MILEFDDKPDLVDSIEKDEKFTAQTVTLEYFLGLAQKGDWTTFDRTVLNVCNNEFWVKWTEEGFLHSDENVRDLAISICEKTTIVLKPAQLNALKTIMDTDESVHLRNKAAIALFRKGNKEESVVKQLQDAQENDPELKDEVTRLLATL